jgi:soluble lytic murein transglycosylase
MQIKSVTRRHLAIVAVAMASLDSVRAHATDQLILAAADAFQKKDATRLARHVEPTRTHRLGQYVEYWALRVNLDDQPVAAIQSFLGRNEGTFVADRLRGEWLRSLGKRGHWETFQSEYAGYATKDPEIICYGILAQQRLGEPINLDAYRPIWREPKDLPEGCAALADQLARDSQLAVDLVWDRARALSENGFTTALKKTLTQLPPKDAVSAALVEQILANPQRAFEPNGVNLATRGGRELFAMALGRIARLDPQRAATLFPPAIQARFPELERAHAFAQIALPGARNHLPESVNWYAQTGKAILSEEQLAWKVRSALRAQNWPEVERTVVSMGPAQKEDPTWTYWRARALRALDQGDAANELFGKIAGQHNFYGNLAAEEIGGTIVIPPPPAPILPDELVAIGEHPGLQRALALMKLQLRTDAVREWIFSTRGLSDRELLAAAELARNNQIWDRVISTADRTLDHHDFRLRYLAPYRDVFAAKAGLYGLEESWVLGIARQESRFIVNAKSSAGASGLMQLMPNTAQLVAKRIGMKSFTHSRITEPEINIHLGTRYMRQVLDDLDGHPLLASAAYNAGPRRAQQWRAATPIEGAIYAESIPFNETRDYVKRVFSNTMYYARLNGGEVAPLKTRLGVISPRPSGLAVQ